MKKDSTAIEYSNGPLASNGKFKVAVPMTTPRLDQATLEAVARVERFLNGDRRSTEFMTDLRTILDALAKHGGE